MTNPQHHQAPDRPFGSDPQRPAWPLILYGLLVAACVVFLFLMALLYSGR